MKTITNLILGIFIITLISCESDEAATSAVGDAFIIAKKTEQDTIYGLSLHAVSNKNFTTVSASPKDVIDVAYELSAFNGLQYNFLYETEENNFGTSLPQTGVYEFSANMENGENIKFTDNLTDDIIYPPLITDCQYDDTNENIEIEWEEDDDVDVYNVKIYKTDGTAVFIGSGINPENDNYSLDVTTTGWLNNYTPNNGESYTVELNAYMYEAIKADMNLQCISMSTHTVTWGAQ